MRGARADIVEQVRTVAAARGGRRSASRSSTCSSAARRAAWCCGCRSIGPDRRRPPKSSVSVEDCARVSRDLSAVLDVEDAVPSAYILEVSSPGLDRPLRKADDYRRFAGRRAKVVMREAIDGQGFFKGRLAGVEETGRRADRRRRWPAAPGAGRPRSRARIWKWSSSEAARGGREVDRGQGPRSEKCHRIRCSKPSRRLRRKKASSPMSSSPPLKRRWRPLPASTTRPART